MTDSSRLEELKRRVQRDPASISFAALAEEYRKLGLIAEAIETCRAGLLRHPAYISARVTLGRALVEIGEFDEASVELEQVLRSAPENLAAIRALADIHRRRGEMPEKFDPEHFEAPVAEARIAVSTMAGEPSASAAEPTAVQSPDVAADPELPALVELEAFLVAIERARRDVAYHAAR
jgi:tetratricopeptide (TPR) repeat protein